MQWRYGLLAGALLACPPAWGGNPRAGPAQGNPYRLTIDPGDYRLCFAAPEAATTPKAGRPAGLAALIDRQARSRGLDPALIHAVVRAESGYRPAAVSPKGAVGLMQVMPDTGRRFGVADLLNPEHNIDAGTAYLSYLLELFRDLPLALAAYNAGEGAVLRHGRRVPPYRETRAYVQSVLKAYGAGAPDAARPEAARRLYLPGTRLDRRGLSDYRLTSDPWRDGAG